MKQGKLYFRIVQLILLAAVLVYLGYAVFSAVSDPLTTTTIIEYEAGKAYTAQGYVARAERVVTSSFPINVLACAEGEKVAAGGVLAAAYTDASAQDLQDEIASLQEQLAQLQAAGGSDFSNSDAAALDVEIYDTLALLAQATAQRNSSTIRTTAGSLKGLMLQRDIALGNSTGADIAAQIAEITARLSSLSQQTGSSSRQITTDTAGWFSGIVDGFETVLTPDALLSLTVSAYNALESRTVSENAFGRVVTSSTWYYVTVVPTEYLGSLRTGNSLTVDFSDYLPDTARMTIEFISGEENGTRVLVLSCNKYIQNVTSLRSVTANLIFASYSGLRVPKDAIRYVDGQVGVYVLDGAEAVWKPVEILYDNGESYVVAQDKSNVANLWAGDEVIVDAKNLYDGKVVK